MGLPGPRRTHLVVAAYGRLGGGILADGLAYNALFALLPALLLVAAVVGLVVQDPARQTEIVDAIAAYVPPLRDLLGRTLDAMSAGAAQVSIVGLVTLVWGASRFARAMDTSFDRVFDRRPERGIVRRSLLGITSVVVLIAAVVAALGLASVGSLVMAGLGDRAVKIDLANFALLNPLVAAGTTAAGVAAVYRYMPPSRPSWRAIGLPALVVGVGAAIFTQIFTFVAPRLIGIAVLYGAVAATFAVLAWLSIVAQLLLLGLVWVRFREEGWPARERRETR